MLRLRWLSCEAYPSPPHDVDLLTSYSYAFAPLLILFEDEPPMPDDSPQTRATPNQGVDNTALLIPCVSNPSSSSLGLAGQHDLDAIHCRAFEGRTLTKLFITV